MIKIDMDDVYPVVKVCGVMALFDDCRIDRSSVPEGLYCYDLHGGRNDDPGDPATVEEHVTVNHAGCILTKEPLKIPECGYLDIGEGLDFTEHEMTPGEFLAFKDD